MDIQQWIDPNIISMLQSGGYILMFFLMLVEGPLVTIAAAFLASMGIFDIFVVAILGWAGDFFGDMLFFYIGRRGKALFARHTKPNTRHNRFFEKLDDIIHSNLMLAIALIKITPYAPPIGIPYIGRSDIAFSRYIQASFVTCLPVPIAAVLIGFHMGTISQLIHQGSLLAILPYLILVIIITISIWIFSRFLRQKKYTTFGEDINLKD